MGPRRGPPGDLKRGPVDPRQRFIDLKDLGIHRWHAKAFQALAMHGQIGSRTCEVAVITAGGIDVPPLSVAGGSESAGDRQTSAHRY